VSSNGTNLSFYLYEFNPDGSWYSGLSSRHYYSYGGMNIANVETLYFKGFPGIFSFTGSNGNERIQLGQGNDSLDGGLGTDTLIITEEMGANDLVINVSDTANQLTGIGGTVIANFEQFDLSKSLGTLTFTGSNGNDWVKAGLGNDNLNGGLGADQLWGGLGNDTYIVDNIRDVVTENANEG
ncbi:MAG: hypothetical protein ACKO5Q_11795, partial [Microcystaceae cyanobacterium]